MKINVITKSAAGAAFVFAATFLIRVPVPLSAGGYVNFGDTVIYMCAFAFGALPAAASAAIGSVIADLVVGANVYAPATLLIKGIMGLVCGLIMSRHRSLAVFAIASAVGGLIMSVSYMLYELAVFNWEYALFGIPYNIIQWVGGTIAAIALYPFLKRYTAANRV
jgi:uncharacterized membrane protein